MALIIPTLKLGNKTTENAYAKVSRVSVDNNTKKATFNVIIYKSKEDRTVLLQVPMQLINTIVDIDIIHQCYDAIKSKVIDIQSQIDTMQAEQDADLTHSNYKQKFALSKLKANSILYFKDTTDDI